MKFSIHKEDRKNKKLRGILKILRARIPVFNSDWEGVLEIWKGEEPSIIMRIYDHSDVGAATANDGEPQAMVEDGFHMPWTTPVKHTDEFIAGWFFCKLWEFWEEEG